MKLTDRERMIVLLLPAGVVLVAYAWYFAYSVRPKLNSAREKYRAAAAAEVWPGQIPRQQAELQAAKQHVDEFRDQKTQLEREAATLAGQLNNPAVRLQAVSQLTALLERHRLRLIDDAAEKQGSAKLPQALRDAIARLGSGGKTLNAQIRCLRLAGTYRNLMGAVAELTRLPDSPAVPVALNMAEVDPDVDERSWTLWVWM